MGIVNQLKVLQYILKSRISYLKLRIGFFLKEGYNLKKIFLLNDNSFTEFCGFL